MFPLFFGMVMYANEVETKKNIKITWDKKLTTTYILNKASIIIIQILPMHAVKTCPMKHCCVFYY